MAQPGNRTSGEPVGEDVRRAAGGDREAWDRLVGRYTGLLWGIARAHRLDEAAAADVVQTTWLRLLEHLDRLHDPDRVGGWLSTTARHECLAALRDRRRLQPSEPELLDIPDPRGESLDAALLVGERDAALWRAFTSLAERCQRLLRVLMASPPPSYAEAGKALDMPIGSIGPTRERCLRRLRDLLGETGMTSAEVGRGA